MPGLLPLFQEERGDGRDHHHRLTTTRRRLINPTGRFYAQMRGDKNVTLALHLNHNYLNNMGVTK